MKNTVKIHQNKAKNPRLRTLRKAADALWKTSAPNLPNFARRGKKHLHGGAERAKITTVGTAWQALNACRAVPFFVCKKERMVLMPKTKGESVFFTAVTAWLMVYGMTLYNLVLISGSFTNASFLLALREMWLEYGIIFLCAYFISSPIAKKLAFRVVRPGDRPIAIILCIQVFTVVCQVALASILAVWHGNGFTVQFVPDYLSAYCRNFVMAMPLQLLLAGPIARGVFQAIFRRGEAN